MRSCPPSGHASAALCVFRPWFLACVFQSLAALRDDCAHRHDDICDVRDRRRREIIALPIYRALKLSIKNNERLQEFANHPERQQKPLIRLRFFRESGHAITARKGCPLAAAMHDAPDLPTAQNPRHRAACALYQLAKQTLTGDTFYEARSLWRIRPRETRHHR